jgi:hypothetical protein
LRRWLSENDQTAGLIGALSVTALVGALLTAFAYYPLGPVERTSGTILNRGIGIGRNGAWERVLVKAEDRQVPLTISLGNSCRVGGRIHLMAQRRLWGLSIDADWPPCDPTP